MVRFPRAAAIMATPGRLRGRRVAHGLLSPVGALGLAVLVLACSARGEAARERAAVMAYAAAASDVRGLQHRFHEAFRACHGCRDAAELRARGRDEVLPAFDALARALTQMPLETARLKTIHGPLLAECEAFRAELVRFVETVTDANIERRAARLETAWARLGAHVIMHRDALEAYVTQLGIAQSPTDSSPGVPAGSETEGRGR